jgi:GPH family glycoside/pentoside/hexuronide:cation symporter
MTGPAERERLPVGTKLAFGLGSAAETIALAAVGSYAMFYYNQVLGMPATLAGLAITASLIFDGIADPIFGSLSDRTRSRLGRRHPFMYAAPLPVAASLVAVFNPPAGLPEVWLFAWFAVFVISLRVSMAVYHTPHLALGGELSPSYTERTRVMSYSNLFAGAGTAGTGFVALSFFFDATPRYPRGLLNPGAYAGFSMTAAAITLTILLASAWFTRSQIRRLPPPAADVKPFSAGAFARDIGAAFGNRNYLFLLIAVFFFSMLVSLRTGLSLYMNTFFWGLTSEQIRWFSLAGFLGYLISFTATARINQRFGKRRTMAVCAVLYGVVPAIPVSLRLADLMPPGDSPWLTGILFVSAACGAVIGGVIAITALSALADIADENELRYGLRQEGVLFSTRTLFSKIDSAVGHLAVGLVLDLMHFPKHADPHTMAPAILWKLGLFDGPLAVLPGLIAAFFYVRYAIDRRAYDLTRGQLDAAHARRAALAAASLQADLEDTLTAI